jgi:hypothetical protein
METRFTDQTGIVIANLKAYNVTLKKNVNVWGHYDTSDGGFSHVGPWYKTKEECLSDHEDYLRRAGWLTT